MNNTQPSASEDKQCIILAKNFPNFGDQCVTLPSFYWALKDCNAGGAVICKKRTKDLDCIFGSGSNYQGSINLSKTGNTCLHWNDLSLNLTNSTGTTLF